MKISTKMGDEGISSLFSSKKLKKNNVFFEFLGNCDELIALIGLFVSENKNSQIDEDLKKILDDLYRISSIIGFEFKIPSNISDINIDDLNFLESKMESYKKIIPETNSFIKFFHSIPAAKLNIIRTQVRKLERTLVSVLDLGFKHEYILKYTNRLSDLFFVYSLFFEKDFNLEKF